tara:strand:- start:5466 stop:5687 length:222 start_codon:yes stop_codon:yes gene_type:complete
MMIEFWWKVFLASIVIIIVSKLFGSTASIIKIFSIAFISCTVVLILLIVISDFIWQKWKNRNNEKEEEKLNNN